MGVPLLKSMLLLAASATAAQYTVELTEHRSLPLVSRANKPGHGHSPCNMTFNPSYVPPDDAGGFKGGLLVRLNQCVNTTIAGEHVGFVPCEIEGSDVSCGDLDTSYELEAGSEDPRAFLFNGTYYNFYFTQKKKGPKCSGSQCTVALASTKTPADASSWKHITTLPWHRNGCCIRRESPPHYCIFGEGSSDALKQQFPEAGPWPMPGLGIAKTMDFDTGEFEQVNWTAADPSLLGYASTTASPPATTARWLDAFGSSHFEAKLEAGTHPVQLSTGDYLHLYADATPPSPPNGKGNYTAGFIIMDKDDPTKVIQRRANLLLPIFDYETLCNATSAYAPTDNCPYHGERAWVIFLSEAVPTGKKDQFRLFWGGGDGHVGTGLLQVQVGTAV